MLPAYAPWIAGAPRPTGKTREIRNPFDGSVVARVDDADAEGVEAAIASAGRGARTMAAMPSHRRAEILEKVSVILTNRADETAALITAESGKPARDARIEVARCITTFKIAAGEATRIPGEYLSLDAAPAATGRHGIIRRFPIGIISAISPFNFPLNLPAHKVAPAIAAGNSIIMKPAPRTPLASFQLAKILYEAGCPPEALSVITGDPPVIDPLITDPRIAMVSFTGSAAVGWKIKDRAGRKKVALELGGNAAVIVHEDADVEFAVARCIAGSFTFAGQVCIRSQRIFVHSKRIAAFTELLLQKVRGLTAGDPRLDTTEIGPMIDASSAARAWSWVEEAVAAGAELLCGGPPSGAFLPPAILRNAPPDCRASAEEIFAPVVVLEEYQHSDDVLDRVNDSRYGLQTGIFTNQTSFLMKAFERLQVGAVIHQDVPAFRTDAMPYGGVKDSGFGREGPRHAILEMTEPRMLVLRES